jgi:cytochrome c peroxidase
MIRLVQPAIPVSRRIVPRLAILILFCQCTAWGATNELLELGRRLFFDPTLSEPPGQSCATCHDPLRAFSDSYIGPGVSGTSRSARTLNGALTAGALSPGADGTSLIDRNTPSLTYVGTIPPFMKIEGLYSGGLFLDGRSRNLTDQVRQPLLNPREMGQPDAAAISRKVLANEGYRRSLTRQFGRGVLDDDSELLDAISLAIAAFERSDEFSSFDSKYDRYLTGEYTMTREEALGRELFFSDLVNCVQCHVNEPGKVAGRETFTNHRFHNIGVPINSRARLANGLGMDHRDPGLLANPQVSDARAAGKFRVPTLRNVAVTPPYMHNGVFNDLHTAVLFYGRYTLSNRPSQIDPETQQPWRDPEIPETIDLEILEGGQPIDSQRASALVAFLKTLTDKRYEHLLD